MLSSFHLSSFSVFFNILHPSITSTFFFFNDTATTEIYTLSLHDALPISRECTILFFHSCLAMWELEDKGGDRKSTRLNSSHQIISYAVFCLKKKKETIRSLSSVRLKQTSPTFAD